MTEPLETRCIWCHDDTAVIGTNDSHVFPAALGNIGDDAQVLPPGIVCSKCNNFFGRQIEVAFAREPHIHVLRVTNHLQDRHGRLRQDLFDTDHPAVGGAHMVIDTDESWPETNKLRLKISHTVTGAIERQFTRRELSMFSRAIHKIAFETFVWLIRVDGQQTDPPSDVYSDRFDPIRQWARYGQPMNQIRPVLRAPPLVGGETVAMAPERRARIYEVEGEIVWDENMFFELYSVALTGDNPRVRQLFIDHAHLDRKDFWIFGETVASLARLRGEAHVGTSSIEVQSAHLVEDVIQPAGGPPTLNRIWDTIHVGGFPASMRPNKLWLRLKAKERDAGRSDAIVVGLIGPSAQDLGGVTVTLTLPDPLRTLDGLDYATTDAIVPLESFVLMRPGPHRLEVRIGGRFRGAIPFTVTGIPILGL